jgi:hypothetical protein
VGVRVVSKILLSRTPLYKFPFLSVRITLEATAPEGPIDTNLAQSSYLIIQQYKTRKRISSEERNIRAFAAHVDLMNSIVQ